MSLLEPKTLKLALLLRGILSHEVLRVVLEKRWRVQYGAHPKRKGYEMAVPFKGKDVAQERTDFGHPDVCLALTILHYYMQGLSEKQLLETFSCLDRQAEDERKNIYQQWINEVELGEKSELFYGIEAYDGINLTDLEAVKIKLFPVFSKHIGVINFWLKTKVFPVFAKQFPYRLVSTAGDLCLDFENFGVKAITTGFSETDDMACPLPLTIKQSNL